MVNLTHIRSTFVLALAANPFIWNVISRAENPAESVVTTTSDQGYYPTLAESALLRGAYDSRSQGGFLDAEEGPDRQRLVSPDLFPYEDPNPNFYQRNQDFFKPLDRGLGVFTQFDAVTYEFSSLDNTSLTVDGNLGILNRQFSPELAMIKAGPLYFDLLWIGAGAIWSDYNGFQGGLPNFGERDGGDGATAYVDIGLRGLLRFTDSIYLSVIGNIIYLPFENDVALQFGSGRDAGLFTRLNYSETFGAWDINLYDEFQGRPGLNLYGQFTRDATDRAGRYFYGFQTLGRSNQFYNRDYVVFSNVLALNATRLVFDNQWRFGFDLDHTDYWSDYSFENHTKRDHAGVWLGYEGSSIPFAPRISYDLYSYDGYESLWHRAYLDLTGRITENISWGSRVGGAYTTGAIASQNVPLLWEVHIDHAITNSLSHWIAFGQDIYDSELNNQSVHARYVRWNIDQRLGRRLHAQAFLQFSDTEATYPQDIKNNERTSVGFSLRYHPLDFTQIVATALYEKYDQTRQPSTDSDRWLYRVEAIQQLGVRLTGNVFYQYEDSNNYLSSYTEHVLGVSLRRYF